MYQRVIMRRIFAITGLVAGFLLSFFSAQPFERAFELNLNTAQLIGFVALGTAIGGVLGLSLAPVAAWAEARLQRTPIQEIAGGVIGLIVGLMIANLFGAPFYQLSWPATLVPIVTSVLFGYLGLSVGAKKRDELVGLFNWRARERDRAERARTDAPERDDRRAPSDLPPPAVDRGTGQGSTASPSPPSLKILDTNVLIDGRIIDVCRAGFIEGTLVVPVDVLEELRHIADSPDSMRRSRGRRGLDILARLQRESPVPVEIWDKPGPEASDVDDRLIWLARQLGGKIITQDYNLNKVAQVHGVSVLNINELANAVKPMLIPGEELSLQVIRDGKEPGQGVGYLDDGTMVVIEHGKRHVGETVTVVVTSVLQTAAGRMIFARPKVLDVAGVTR